MCEHICVYICIFVSDSDNSEGYFIFPESYNQLALTKFRTFYH